MAYRHAVKILAVATFFLGSIEFLAGQAMSSAKLYGLYAAIISQSPLSKADFESLKPQLQKEGFATSDNIYWRMNDSAGMVLLFALPDQGNFSVKFFPHPPTALGDAALAALINKAEHIEIGDGDAITIALHLSNIAKGQRTGTRTEYLTFNLHGGLWQESVVYIDWK